MGYDVLDNERHKAIAELRKLNSENFGCKQFMGDLLSAIDPNWINRASTFDEATLNEYMRDRLIHLLGGDQPSGTDELREMDERETEDRITDELRELVDDYWPIELEEARILRDTDGSVPHSLLTIADRIGARHYLTSVVAEASKSDAWIAMSEYDKLREERDELREEVKSLKRAAERDADHIEALSAIVDDMTMERESIGKELRQCVEMASKSYDNTAWHEMDGNEDEHTWCSVTVAELLGIADRIDQMAQANGTNGQPNGTCPNDVRTSSITDELREFVDNNWPKILHETKTTKAYVLLTIADRIDEQFDRMQETVDEMVVDQGSWKTTADIWKAIADDMGRERAELQEKLDEYDSTHVELPRDANGEVFRLGCTVRMVERHPEVLLTVHSMTLCDDGEWRLYAWDDKNKYSCNLSTSSFEVCDRSHDSAESIVRDLSMGAVTEAEAIERIEALNG